MVDAITKIFFLILMVSVGQACKKEQQLPGPSPYDKTPCPQAYCHFIIDDDDTLVNFRGEINQSVGSGPNDQGPFQYEYYLDLDNNSKADLTFIVLRSESTSNNQFSKTITAVVNTSGTQLQILSHTYRDSLASYTQNQTWTTEPYAPLFSYPPDAKIFYNNYTVPNIFNEGDTFNFAEAGAIHTVPFYEDFQSWSNPGNQSQYHHKSYGTWAGSGTHYIGIKYFIGERIMLGWVKLSVEMNQIFLHKYVLKTVEEL